MGDRVDITISKDGRRAWASVIAGEDTESSALGAALSAAGVTHGLDAEVIDEFANGLLDPTFSRDDVELALATEPVDAVEPGYSLEFVPGLQPVGTLPDGRSDFHARSLFKPVDAGDLVARVHVDTPGKDGVGVDGRELHHRSTRHLKLRLGEGVETLDDGRVVARIDGVIQYVDGESLDVSTHVEHVGDVDLRSGDIESRGSIAIKGDVTRTFTVQAGGDLEVTGSVIGGTLYVRGCARVNGGVMGGETGAVAVEVDIEIHHAQDARIRCGGLLRVDADLVNTDVQATRVEVSGRVIGGEIIVEHEMVLQDAGAPRGAPACLRAGEPRLEPVVAAREIIARARAARLVSRRARGSVRHDGSRAAIKGGKAGRDQSAADRAQVRHEVVLRKRLTNRASIVIRGTARVGTRICIGRHSILLDGDVHARRYYFDQTEKVVRNHVLTAPLGAADIHNSGT